MQGASFAVCVQNRWQEGLEDVDNVQMMTCIKDGVVL